MSLKQELWVTVTKDPRLVPLYSSIGCGLELLKPQDSSHNLQCYTEHVHRLLTATCDIVTAVRLLHLCQRCPH